MLTRIIVGGDNPFFLPIRKASPRDSILLRKVTGLETPDIDLFVGDRARDGGDYTGRRVSKRNIVMEVSLNPDYSKNESVSGLREMLNKAFLNPRSKDPSVSLTFEDSVNDPRYTIGYVETMETAIFGKETVVQVSMLCPDPYIYDSLIVDQTIETGMTSVVFVYTGSAQTGFELEVDIVEDTDSLSIVVDDESMNLTHPFLQGDRLSINTVLGKQRVVLQRGANPPIDILGSLSAQSPWIQLHEITNTIQISSQSGFPATIRSFRFRPAHWGM